jgi:hypothetical protein
LTRSSARKLQSQEETPTKRPANRKEKKKTTHGEDQHTFKILRKQLREAQNVIIQLMEEDRQAKIKCSKNI